MKRINIKGNSYKVDKLTPKDYIYLTGGTKEQYEKLTGKKLKAAELPEQWKVKKESK